MKTVVLIKDCTLLNSETDKSFKISFKEKLEIAKQLENINTDIIETGYADGSQAELIAVKTIAGSLRKSILCCPSKLNKTSIDKTYEAVKCAVKPRIHISAPVSAVNMEYQLHMKKDQLFENIKECVNYAKSLCDDIEFTALDATRADKTLLIEVLKIAISSGASTVGIEDSVGHMLPEEVFLFIDDLKKQLSIDNSICLSFKAKNDLGMAVANSVCAIKSGANQISCSINGLANDASLEDTATAILTRSDDISITSNITASQINRASVLLSGISDTKNIKSKGISLDNKVNEETELLDKQIDIYTFRTIISDLGYSLTDKDIERIYDMFKELAEKKQQIYIKDIEAIIGREAIQVPRVYQLDRFVINSGNKITSTAAVKLKYNEKTLEGVAFGDGPIDAAFHVIEKIMGMDIELFDFNLRSVTEGKDALGAATVKIRYNGNIYIGRGLSTDVIESSIMAYINAVNKMLYEEGIQ